ncbi:helix-turn-helix domain-containing protein [Longispora albida]|uniref:helix-turn-helix domain-containing protein n=1 Tax=Longispora albida TaxID=203523 RepID=UPI000379F53F|nr:helix-turn-helix transcriptional regulator [Longispora albida]
MSGGTGRGLSVRRRRLRFELKRSRDEAGLTQEQVAQEMDWSPSKVIRIEAGAVGISTNDLKALLRLYGVDNPARIAELTELARLTRQRQPWWAPYKEHIDPRYAEYIGYEMDAAVIYQSHPYTIPGLLHTEEYTRVVIADGGPADLTEEVAEILVEVRLRRQREVLERPKPPAFHLVLGEAALRILVGGQQVMRNQLTYLLDVARRPEVTLQIVPFSAGAYAGLIGPFTILEFADPIDDDVAYLEGSEAGLIRDSPEQLSGYRQAFDQVVGRALSPADSAGFVATIREELSSLET